MNKEQILNSWQKSAKLPRLPDHLQEFVRLYFEEKSKVPSPILKNYIESRMELLFPFLENPFFSPRTKIKEPDDFFRENNLEVLRTLLFLEWFSEEKLFDIHEALDEDAYKQDAFVGGFSAYFLAKVLLLPKPHDLFILSYFRDIGMLGLAGTFPSLFEGVRRLSGINQLEPAEQEKIIGVHPSSLSAWILERWGFPPEFLDLLTNEDLMNDKNISARVIYFSRFISHYILNGETAIHYNELEILFKKLFNRNAKELQELLVELMRVLPRQASLFGYHRLEDLTIIEILKDHMDVFDKDLLSYNDLLNEVMKAHRRLRVQAKEIHSLRDQLERNYVKDTITGLYNHTYLREFLFQKIREASRYEFPLTLLLFDLDNFKIFNKEFGYVSGNELLKQMATLIRQNIRQSDILARYGGDEFAIVFPYTGLPHSRTVAEKIADLVSGATFKDSYNYTSHKITISIGFASTLPGQSSDYDEKLISLVTKALQKSQKMGGNSITQAEA